MLFLWVALWFLAGFAGVILVIKGGEAISGIRCPPEMVVPFLLTSIVGPFAIAAAIIALVTVAIEMKKQR